MFCENLLVTKNIDNTPMKTTLIFIMAFLTGLLNSCGEDIESLDSDSSAVSSKKSGDLIATLQVLNMEGEPQAIFKQGENFMLSLIIKNKSKHTVELCQCDLPYAIDDFFAVYRVFEDDNGNREKKLIGKPFDGLGGAYDSPITGVRGKQQIEYRIPWMVPLNESFSAPENNISATIDYFIPVTQEPLSAGAYTVGFSLDEYGIDDEFSIYFTVE